MGFPTSFSSSTIVTPPDAGAPVASVLDYLEGALSEHDANVVSRDEGLLEFKVSVGTRLLRSLTPNWRLGSAAWPLSYVGSGTFTATELRDRVVVAADLRITQFLLARGALFGVVSGAIGALGNPGLALIIGAGAGLGIGGVSYALAKWEFGLWFQRLDRMLREAREAAA